MSKISYNAAYRKNTTASSLTFVDVRFMPGVQEMLGIRNKARLLIYSGYKPLSEGIETVNVKIKGCPRSLQKIKNIYFVLRKTWLERTLHKTKK